MAVLFYERESIALIHTRYVFTSVLAAKVLQFVTGIEMMVIKVLYSIREFLYFDAQVGVI